MNCWYLTSYFSSVLLCCSTPLLWFLVFDFINDFAFDVIYDIIIDFCLFFFNSILLLRLPVSVNKFKIFMSWSKSITLLIEFPSADSVSWNENRSILRISKQTKFFKIFHCDFRISIYCTRWRACKWYHVVAIFLWFAIFHVSVSSSLRQFYFFSTAVQYA